MFVPVQAQVLRQTLRDPARVARCLPGLQQDAGEPPIAGRLKVRLGGSTITYRGALRITEQDDGAFAVEGEGVEVRGAGAAQLTLTVRLDEAPGGTTLGFAGTALAEGRAADVPADTSKASALRLLDRFAAALAHPARPENAAAGAAGTTSDDLATATGSEPSQAPADLAETDLNTDLAGGTGSGAAGASEPDLDSAGPGPDSTDRDATDLDASDLDASDLDAGDLDAGDLDAASFASVFDAEVPPPSLDPLADQEFAIEVGGPMPAEAAHARRTMIGRSAEEVDHAPPRGRYAPVPAPSGSTAGATLRWVAPAAALALASAVVVGRALRRRR
ncbi:SRPBCC domain-containing protein [Streptomyces sp. NPDC048361]|uniref:SRPBCC domain-containing protein n=1 Tax=Streptomyces sp. NPDC048361 TaxID=3154720 RepID=UPI0034270659